MQVQRAYADHAAATAAGDVARAAQISEWIARNPAYASSTTTSHTFHLLMTVFTLGLWAPVWLCVAIVHAARR
jgi:hypothetical protein